MNGAIMVIFFLLQICD